MKASGKMHQASYTGINKIPTRIKSARNMPNSVVHKHPLYIGIYVSLPLVSRETREQLNLSYHPSPLFSSKTHKTLNHPQTKPPTPLLPLPPGTKDASQRTTEIHPSHVFFGIYTPLRRIRRVSFSPSFLSGFTREGGEHGFVFRFGVLREVGVREHFGGCGAVGGV